MVKSGFVRSSHHDPELPWSMEIAIDRASALTSLKSVPVVSLWASLCFSLCFQVRFGEHYHLGRVCWRRGSEPFFSTRPATAPHLQLAVQHWNHSDPFGLHKQLTRHGAQRCRPLEYPLPRWERQQRSPLGRGPSVLEQPLGSAQCRWRQGDRKPNAFEYSAPRWPSQRGVHLGHQKKKMEVTIISTKGKKKVMVTLSSPGHREESSFNRSDWQPFFFSTSVQYWLRNSAEVLVNC